MEPRPQWLRARFRLLLTFLLLGYGVMCLLSCTLVVYLRRHRRSAFSGDAQAARRIILPAYEPLLVVLAAATFLYSAYIATALATNIYEFRVTRLATEVFYAGRQFVFLSVVVFMLQKSVSRQVLQRSLLLTFLLATYTVPVVAVMVTYAPQSPHFYTVVTSSRALLLLLYVYVFLHPPVRASKHTLREFCVYAFIYYALLFTYNELFRRDQFDWGFLLTYANLVWGSLCPLVIWRVLKADTDHWRGLGQRAVALQQGLSSSSSSVNSSGTALRSHLLPPECISSQGHHVLIEMHRKYIVDFAYLEVKQRIGTGASAAVFHGVLRGTRHVAVKVYTPRVLDEITVAQFSQEAALCGALRHPNIVQFVGLCVSPPTICLVSELCVGTLEDVTSALALRHPQSPLQRRQQTLINLAYMVDAARAVAYLHSFTPPFLHRDIRPANFLIDSDNTVKLTHFGESRSLPRSSMMAARKRDKATSRQKPNSQHKMPAEAVNTEPQILSDTMRTEVDAEISESHSPAASFRSSSLSLSSLTTSEPGDRRLMTIKGTVDYMAPELLRGQESGQASYGEAVDVYALAITMWDILYPGQEKYPRAGDNTLKKIDGVLAGERPRLPDGGIHPTLAELLVNAWHDDARLRPSTQQVVGILEALQEELTAPFAGWIHEHLQAHRLLKRDGERELASGESIVEMLRVNQYVDSDAEAVRLGNMLMDAGMIHHSTHRRPMEASEEERYYFDHVKIRAMSEDREPLARSGASHGTSSMKRLKASSSGSLVSVNESIGGSPSLLLSSRLPKSLSKKRSRHRQSNRVPSDPTELLSGTGNCACRSLSQRLQQPKKGDASKQSHKSKQRNPPVERQRVLMMDGVHRETQQHEMTIAELCDGPEDPHLSQWDGFHEGIASDQQQRTSRDSETVAIEYHHIV